MGPLKCLLIRMTSFGSGLRLRSFFCVLVVSSIPFTNAAAKDFYWTFQGAGVYDSPAAACTFRPDSYPLFVNPSYYYCIKGNYDVGFASRLGDTCPSGTIENTSTGLCANPDLQKCTDAKGATEKNYSWHQSTDTPIPPSLGGCATTIGTISLCKPSSTGGFDCNADVTVTGDLYIPPPTPEPIPDTSPGTGTGT
ncbi:hypothetical protein QNL38_02210, partial [Pseudomonas amygdali pv. morsprunorum]|nr:hypothetical protein [Pseudomonas amygdali pv. morsprunorum]